MIVFGKKALSLTFCIPVGPIRVEKWWVGGGVTRQVQHLWHLCKGNPQPDLWVSIIRTISMVAGAPVLAGV